jgi:hypothetical protein
METGLKEALLQLLETVPEASSSSSLEKEKKDEVERLLWEIGEIAQDNSGSPEYFSLLRKCTTTEEVRSGMNHALLLLSEKGHIDHTDSSLYRAKGSDDTSGWLHCLERWERIKELECP